MRDLSLSTQMREVVIDAVTLPTSAETVLSTEEKAKSRAIIYAVALKALLPELKVFTSGEELLFAEWLDRLSQPNPELPAKAEYCDEIQST